LRVAERVLDVDSTLQGDKIVMKINEEAMKFIATVLIDLYSDEEMAVIREYCTNAFDAHVEAGVTRPIEVTLPSQLAQNFKVRDYGEGLDAQDIEDIYSQYGASTKRDSDDVVGMLGLGCKSALTYTDQFTLTGIKHGILTQVIVSRDEDGGGSMTIVDHHPTDEPSGVEVTVPTKRGNRFEEKAKNFFRFWSEGTVVVNGEAPKHIDGVWIADDILLTKEVSHGTVVMGNVPYPIPSEYDDRDWRNGYNTVAFVNIGAVNFTPAREALQMNENTKSTLAALKKRVVTERDIALMKRVEEAKNRPDAIVKAAEARTLGLRQKPVWRGQEVPEMLEIEKDKTPIILVEAVKRWRVKGWGAERRLTTSTFERAIWITGYDSDSFSPFKRQKMEQWLEQKGITVSSVRRRNEDVAGAEYVIFCNKLPMRAWIDPKTVYPWSEIKEQKIVREKTKTTSGRPSGSYTGYVAGLYVNIIQAADIDVTKPIFYRDKYEGGHKEIFHLHPDATIVTLGQNRVAKFKRDFPTAKQVTPYIQAQADKWWKSLSNDDKLMLKINESRSLADLMALDASKIDDPELVRVVTILKTNKPEVKAMYNILGRHIVGGATFSWSNPLDAYPLLTSALRYDTMRGMFADHAYLYINAAYAAGQEKS
jgi:hypothetical protein